MSILDVTLLLNMIWGMIKEIQKEDLGRRFGEREHHEYQLFLAIEDIDHTKTKARSPQTNGICERFHKTILQEFYQITFRKKIYQTIEELQADLDEWITYYNQERPHSGRYCYGRTPTQTFKDSKDMAEEKMLDSTLQTAS